MAAKPIISTSPPLETYLPVKVRKSRIDYPTENVPG